MKDLIDEFNRFFNGSAKAEIENGKLNITTGNETLVIQLPLVIGGQSKATDQ
jgi:hypothetical protein